MKNESLKAFLKSQGWTLNCESPFEISKYEDGVCLGFATGEAAEMIIESLIYSSWVPLIEQFPKDRRKVRAYNAVTGREWSECSYDTERKLWRDDYNVIDRDICPTHWCPILTVPEYPEK